MAMGCMQCRNIEISCEFVMWLVLYTTLWAIPKIYMNMCKKHLSAVDPADELAEAGIDSSEAGASAASAPGNNTDEGVAVNDRATRVTLAGVLATRIDTGAEHGLGDVAAVSAVAHGAGHDGDIDALELIGKAAATLREVAPGVSLVRVLS